MSAESTKVYDRPRPAVNTDTAYFWEGTKQNKILIQRCTSCKQLRHPHSPACPSCQSFDWDTVESSGRGTVHSFVIQYHPPVPGFEMPFVAALVDLEEGVRILSNLTDVDHAEIQIGMPVEAYFIDLPEDVRVHQFRPVSG